MDKPTRRALMNKMGQKVQRYKEMSQIWEVGINSMYLQQ